MTEQTTFLKIADDLGIDISKYQMELNLKDSPIKFIILRVSYGMMEDKLFKIFMEEVKKYPHLLVGVYHYYSSNIPWKTQRDKFLEIIQPYLDFIDFIALDLEKYFNNRSRNFALTAIEWMESVEAKTGKRMFIYSNYYVYRDWGRFFSAKFDNYPMWVANYKRNLIYATVSKVRSMLNQGPWVPPSRDKRDWTIWQIDDKFPGPALGVKSKYVDGNEINGGLVQAVVKLVGTPKRWLTLPVPEPDNPDYDGGYHQGFEDGNKEGYNKAMAEIRQYADNKLPVPLP